MKKFICAALVLIMTLAASSAFAEDYVDTTLNLFTEGRMVYPTHDTITYSLLGNMLPGVYCYYVSDTADDSNVVYEYYDGNKCLVYVDEVKDEKSIRIVLSNVITVIPANYIVFYLNSGNGSSAIYNAILDASISDTCYNNVEDFIAAIK